MTFSGDLLLYSFYSSTRGGRWRRRVHDRHASDSVFWHGEAFTQHPALVCGRRSYKGGGGFDAANGVYVCLWSGGAIRLGTASKQRPLALLSFFRLQQTPQYDTKNHFPCSTLGLQAGCGLTCALLPREGLPGLMNSTAARQPISPASHPLPLTKMINYYSMPTGHRACPRVPCRMSRDKAPYAGSPSHSVVHELPITYSPCPQASSVHEHDPCYRRSLSLLSNH